MDERVLTMGDGRSVGFEDVGGPDGTPVLWCHGGPGSRLEPAPWSREAVDRGLRVIGIDRPGYGLSTPRPGRSIADWVPDALAVAAHLGIERFAAVGVSTGGAYALALAALAPSCVVGAVACCAVTDMRHLPARSTMSGPHTHAVWDAPDRRAAIDAAVEAHGEGGSKLLDGGMAEVLAPSDLALFRDPGWTEAAMAGWPAMFAHGLEGYADDRLADGGGWTSFDVGSIRCPVVVLHGAADRMVDVTHAHHTASIVPTAELLVLDGHGHFSIETEVVGVVGDLLERSRRT